jgi:hypothetical protein
MHLEQEDRPILCDHHQEVCVVGWRGCGTRIGFSLNCTVIASTRSSYDVECCTLMVISQSRLTLVQETRFESDR